MVDLNTLIPANSSLQLIDAVNINDGGEILVVGLPLGVQPSKDFELGHLALLVPCDGAEQSCEDSAGAANTPSATPGIGNKTIAAAQQRSTPSAVLAAWRGRFAQRSHLPGSEGSSH